MVLALAAAASAAPAGTPPSAADPVWEPSQYWVLDAYGGVHGRGTSNNLPGPGYWPGRDLARGIAALPDASGAYVVDAYGGLHQRGFAPAVVGTGWWPGRDLTRGIALRPSGAGGWVLDAFGGLHPFGGAPQVVGTGWWPPIDLARGVLATSEQGGYVVDATGRLFPFGDAANTFPSAVFSQRDIIRGIVGNGGGWGGWTVDAYGGLHPFGGAPEVIGTGWWPGQDRVRGAAAWRGHTGGWVVDAQGAGYAFGDAPAIGTTPMWGADLTRGASGAGAGTGSRAAPSNLPPVRRHVTYSIATRGTVYSDLGEFARSAADTYSDARGWRAAGVEFEQVPSGGDFTLWLAAPGTLTSFSSGCSSFYSCTVGRNVIINDDRFRVGSPYWPGPVVEYRHLVINHETGHWLGLGHRGCGGPGQRAPVMMQQSKGLNGCVINQWPLDSELRAVESSLRSGRSVVSWPGIE